MALPDYTQLSHYRFERKFTGNRAEYNRADVFIQNHPEHFRAIYSPRRVNNIYFDTPSLDCFYDNLSGKDQRVKYRIRWYGALFGNVRPILEIKIKKGLAGTKKSYPLLPFSVDESLSREKIRDILKGSTIPDDIRHKMLMLEPVLVNSYQRRYFENFDHRFQITMDTDMEYLHFRRSFSPTDQRKEHGKFVLELKYDTQHDRDADKITQQLSLRLSKNSKYINGILIFYPGIAL